MIGVARKLVMLLSAADPANPDSWILPLSHAVAAAAMDVEVEVYFAGASVRLLAKGVAERVRADAGAGRSAYQLMCSAAELGARFYACAGELQANGLSESDLIAQCCGIAGSASFVARVMDDEWKSLTY